MSKKKAFKPAKNLYWAVIVLLVLATIAIALKYLIFPNVQADSLVNNQYTQGIAEVQSRISGYKSSIAICDSALACYKKAKTKSDKTECLERPGSSFSFSSLNDLKSTRNQYLKKVRGDEKLIKNFKKQYNKAMTAKKNTEACLADIKQTYDYCRSVKKPNPKAVNALSAFNNKYESLATNYTDDLGTIEVFLGQCKIVKNFRNIIRLKGGCGK